MLPREAGKPPESWFQPRFNPSRLASSPNDDGMPPTSSFALRYNSLRLGRRPSPSGMIPLRRLPFNQSSSRFRSRLSDSGMGPLVFEATCSPKRRCDKKMGFQRRERNKSTWGKGRVSVSCTQYRYVAGQMGNNLFAFYTTSHGRQTVENWSFQGTRA